jgi:hypothetical protein
MNKSQKAAEGRRKTWQGHDERNEDLCVEGGYQLFDALTDSKEETLYEAGQMVKDAFWFADKAEEYQETDEALEDKMYERSTRLLKEARDRVGLSYEPMEHRGNGWWKSYRQDDKLGVLKNIAKENLSEVGVLGTFGSTKLLLEAAKAHDENDWQKVDNKLKEYYDIVIQEM